MRLNLRQSRNTWLTLAATTLALIPQSQVLAQSYSYGQSSQLLNLAEYDVGGKRLFLPDWTQITFQNLPPIAEGGEVRIPFQIVRELGYDPSRSWGAGQSADSYMMLGDFAHSFRLQEFALSNIANILGFDLSALSLNDYKLVSWQTAASLTQAIEGFGNLSIGNVKPLYDLFRSQGYSLRKSTKIRQILQQYPRLGNLPLGELGNYNLAKYSLDSIPGLSETKISKYQDWQRSYINQVPGLNQVPFAFFPFTFNNVGFSVLGKADVVFSAAEHGDPKTVGYFISGGASEGSARNPKIKPEDCQPGKPCSYLELQDLFTLGGALHGKRWGSGQQVEGGYGFLKVINGGKEPTGLLPYGSAFKVAMTGADESQGKADFGLYFRACVDTLFLGYNCTPFFIGPVPWFSTRETEAVVVMTTAQSFKVNVPDNYQQEIDKIIAAAGGNSNDSCVEGCIEGDGKTTGTFSHPIARGTRVSSPYGWRERPLNGEIQFHNGIDYAAPLGTPVKSVDGGTVIKVSSNSCSDFGKSSAKLDCGGQLGNWIDVRHADGKVVRYGHLQQNSIKVKPGMSVSKGQVIAGVGNSGWSTGPHLDLRVHDGKGNYENPDKYIRR